MKKPEFKLIEAHMNFHVPAFPELLAPEEGKFVLVYVASGLLHGVLHLPQGVTVYRASGRTNESVMLLIPPGATFTSSFDSARMEAYHFLFSCDAIALDLNRMRYGLTLPDGNIQRLELVHRLTAHEVVLLRPMTEWICKYFYAHDNPGAQFKSLLFFQALFSVFFAIPGAYATHENDEPAVRLQKLIEIEGHDVGIGAMFHELGHSPGWLRARYRERYKENPSVQRREQTLHLAKYYIRRTELPFNEIAKRLGMSSATYFSYYIHHYLGKTPREIRAAAQKRHVKKPRE